jgi:hypothetical protein
MLTLSYVQVVDLCGNRRGKFDVACPFCGPDRRSPLNRKRPVLRVWHQEPGFASFNCARCRERGYVRDSSTPARQTQTSFHERRAEVDKSDAEQRIKIALQIWSAAVPLKDTLGFRYFVERRKLQVGSLELDHCLRWHNGIDAVIGLMTDPRSNKPTGVHRTFLNPDATKRERKMLGKQGVIRLSHDEGVTMGLGITEGIEDGLGVLLAGFAPVWTATSCGAIAQFPAVPGIECLTIFHDDDDPGSAAAHQCARRWAAAKREVRLSNPKDALE